MKKRSLTFKFSLMFVGFTFVTLVFGSILSYLNQTNLYKQQREESIRYVASYLEEVITSDGSDFLWWQKYFVEHYKELLVPHDFGPKEIQEARHKYENLFLKKYPGMILGVDISFDELSEDVKTAYTVYKHEYYLDKFEQAKQRFNLAYVEYVIPNIADKSIMYALDALRDAKIVDDEKYIELGITVTHAFEEHQTEWEAWISGIQPTGYDAFDNEFGKTYAYYMPLYIGTRKLGLIGVEVEIGKVNHEILKATIRQMLMIGGVLILFTLLLLSIIRSQYIRKLVKLSNVIDEYSEKKNPKIAELLKKEVTNEDEISSIMAKFADMIYELELYIQNLTKTKQALQDTRQQAIELNELAIKDSLTGIRNKTGYDKEVQKIEWEMASGLKKIGVVMIDLNFLKRINDTYGHDKGNIAIVSLSRMVCHIFEHSPVFRIGGDEFVVILKGHDLENIDELVTEFNWQLKQAHDNPTLEYWEKISAAIGYAIYNPEIDSAYENIFKRADVEMYKNKKAMKAVREE